MLAPKTALAALLLVALARSAAAVDCPATDDCLACIAVPGCGFCADYGLTPAERCIEDDAEGPSSCANWRFDASFVGNDVPGFPLTPSAVDAYLVSGQAIQVDVAFTVPVTDALPLDLMFLQDASTSMEDNIRDLRDAIPELFNSIVEFQYDTQFGLGSFIDHPTSASGGPTGGWSDNIRLYSRESPLTVNFNEVRQQITTLDLAGNWDNPETALDALLFATVCPASDPWGTGWRQDSRKVAVIVTDAPLKCEEAAYCPNTCCNGGCFDTPSDANPARPAVIGGGTPNNYDCVADRSNGRPAEYYPSLASMRTILSENDVIPLFITPRDGDVCDGFVGGQNLRGQYLSIIGQLGRGGWAELGSDFSTAIVNFLRSLGNEVRFEVVPGPYSDLVSSLTDDTRSIPVGESTTFSFTLLRSSQTIPGTGDPTIVLQVPGFGDAARITVHLKDYLFTCDNCSPAPAGPGPFVFDVCGVCGGNGETCLGCDGLAYPPPATPPVADDCMTCPGNGNQACTGCDGELYPPVGDSIDEPEIVDRFPGIVIEDDCGVCGGGNECFDCFGVRDGPAVVDRCGICNGDSDTCLGCDGLPYAPPLVPPVLDICQVCGGDNSTCTGCDGIINSTATFDSCNVCRQEGEEFTLECIGCDGIPFSGNTVDACGKCGGSVEDEAECNQSGDDPAVVIGASVAGAVAGVAAAVGAFIFYQYKKKGANWYVADVFAESTAATSNPLYESNTKSHHNPLFSA